MKYDLWEIPFSMRGSYMAISWLDERLAGKDGKEGLYLRTIHGAARESNTARLEVLCDGAPCAFTAEAEPERVVLRTDEGELTLVYADEDTLLIGGTGSRLGIRLDFQTGRDFDFVQPVQAGQERWYLANCFRSYIRYMLFNQKGDVRLQQEWKVSGAKSCQFDVLPDKRGLLLIIEEVRDTWIKKEHCGIEDAYAQRRAEFRAFQEQMLPMPKQYAAAAEKAAYVNWSSLVSPCGLLGREAMLMSKNWMCNVWSWDHCFNALALAGSQQELAWDQFMLMFDYQSATGRIPDSVNDSIRIDNYCKPPIHGWTLRKLRRTMELTGAQLEEAYEKLGKWTHWWLNYRDQDGDGLCEYTHGNDSGWDNSTAFQLLPPVTLPDLAAFLVIQMDELGEVAELLGRREEAVCWRQRSESMLERMLSKLFQDGKPLAIQTLTGNQVPTNSLILYLPIVLGMRLPSDIREYLIGQLKSEAFLTAHGLATESPSSGEYEADGYWRGPIWAPSTMLIADGLWECGEYEFVRVLAKRFCENVAASGCAENFDALTGKGLRDRAYTWTSSVMFLMGQFLRKM